MGILIAIKEHYDRKLALFSVDKILALYDDIGKR
jgi:hypothetical protein